jgi:hypothetical protein
MTALLSLWGKLTDRQKVVARFSGSWATIWLLDHLADSIFGSRIIGSPVAIALDFIRLYALNGYVACAIAGGLVIGFWPDIATRVRHVRIIALFLVTALIIAVGAGVPYLSDYLESRHDPRLFSPPAAVRRDPNGTIRSFINQQPKSLMADLGNTTALAAAKSLQDDKAKWMAITGTIDDATFDEFSKSVDVSLKNSKGETDLIFEEPWKQKIAAVPKGGNIFAICNVKYANSFRLMLAKCELTHPDQVNK